MKEMENKHFSCCWNLQAWNTLLRQCTFHPGKSHCGLKFRTYFFQHTIRHFFSFFFFCKFVTLINFAFQTISLGSVQSYSRSPRFLWNPVVDFIYFLFWEPLVSIIMFRYGPFLFFSFVGQIYKTLIFLLLGFHVSTALLLSAELPDPRNKRRAQERSRSAGILDWKQCPMKDRRSSPFLQATPGNSSSPAILLQFGFTQLGWQVHFPFGFVTGWNNIERVELANMEDKEGWFVHPLCFTPGVVNHVNDRGSTVSRIF